MDSVAHPETLSKIERRTMALFVAYKLAEHAYPGETKRLERAFQIALYPEQIRWKGAGQTLVQSQGHCNTWFLVTQEDKAYRCSCPDQQALCKHVLAVLLAARTRCLMGKQYMGTDMKDQAYGVATQVQLGEETGWVFQDLSAPDPHYVPRWRLLLYSHCCIDTCAV